MWYGLSREDVIENRPTLQALGYFGGTMRGFPDAATQEVLPGTQSDQVVAVEQAAYTYVAKRDARMAMGREEKAAYQALVAAMLKHKLKTYHRGGVTITEEDPETKFKVKVEDATPED